MANYAGNLVLNGLGTFTIFQAPEANNYFIDAKISLPTLVGGGGASSLVAVIKQNSSTIYTGLAGAEGFKVDVAAASGDTFSVVLSSAAAADNALNAIKTTIAFGEGL